VGVTTDRSGKVLYVANSMGNDVSLLDLTIGAEIKRLASWRSPHHLSLSLDGRRVYVANLLGHLGSPNEPPVSELVVIDTAKQRVAERIEIPECWSCGTSPRRRDPRVGISWCRSYGRRI